MTRDLTPAVLLSAFERRGWHTEPLSQGWRAHQPAMSGDVFLSTTPSWITLFTLVQAGDDSSEELQHRQWLLRNEAMFMAKYCRDHQGVITLQVDVPRTASLLDYALDAITRYCDQPASTDPTIDRISPDHYYEKPPGIPPEVLAYYLRAMESYGWGLHGKPKGITWLLVYKGYRVFEAYLTVTQAWAYFQLPLVPDQLSLAESASHAALFEYMLGINQVLYLAKLGINEAGQVMLMVDWPTQELDFDRFRLITRLLAQYADLYAREVQIMAHVATDHRLTEYLNNYR